MRLVSLSCGEMDAQEWHVLDGLGIHYEEHPTSSKTGMYMSHAKSIGKKKRVRIHFL